MQTRRSTPPTFSVCLTESQQAQPTGNRTKEVNLPAPCSFCFGDDVGALPVYYGAMSIAIVSVRFFTLSPCLLPPPPSSFPLPLPHLCPGAAISPLLIYVLMLFAQSIVNIVKLNREHEGAVFREAQAYVQRLRYSLRNDDDYLVMSATTAAAAVTPVMVPAPLVHTTGRSPAHSRSPRGSAAPSPAQPVAGSRLFAPPPDDPADTSSESESDTNIHSPPSLGPTAAALLKRAASPITATTGGTPRRAGGATPSLSPQATSVGSSTRHTRRGTRRTGAARGTAPTTAPAGVMPGTLPTAVAAPALPSPVSPHLVEGPPPTALGKDSVSPSTTSVPGPIEKFKVLASYVLSLTYHLVIV